MPPNNLSAYLRRAAHPPDPGATDAALLDRFEAGDQPAFAELIRRHGPTVYGVCRRVLAHDQDAEDAFQTVFLMLAQQAHRIDRHRLVNWLHTVACRAAINAKVRRARRTLREQRAELMNARDTSGEPDWDEVRAILDDALLALPPRLRAVVLLCDVGGKTHREAAAELGVPSGSVSGLLQKARRRLRDGLLARGVTLSAAALTALCATRGTAAVPPALAAAAARLGAGPAPALGGTSDLAHAVARDMLLGQLRKLGLALAVLIAVTAGAAGFAVGRNAASPPPPPDAPPVALTTQPVPPAPSRAVAPAPRPVPRLGHRGAVVALAVSPDGALIASSGADGTVRVWDGATGAPVRRFDGPPGGTRVLAFNPIGTLLTIEGADGKVARHRVAGAPETLPMDLKFPEVAQEFVYSADGLYAGVLGRNSVRVVYLAQPDRTTVPTRFPGRLFSRADSRANESKGHEPRNAVAFRPDGTTLVWADTFGEVRWADLTTGKKSVRKAVGAPGGDESLPTAVALDAGGRYAAWGGPSGEVVILDLQENCRLYQAQLKNWGAVRTAAFAPTDEPVLVVADGARVAVIRAANGRLSARPLGEGLPRVESVAFRRGGGTALLGLADGRIREWDLETRKEVLPPTDAP